MSIEARILHNMFGELCVDRFNAALALAKSQAAESALRESLKDAEERNSALIEASRADREGDTVAGILPTKV